MDLKAEGPAVLILITQDLANNAKGRVASMLSDSSDCVDEVKDFNDFDCFRINPTKKDALQSPI